MGVGQELHKIIVVGIPTNSTAEDLRLLCKPFGAIQEATVVSDADGIGRGFGFVRFANEEAQLTAVTRSAQRVPGSSASSSVAEPATSRSRCHVESAGESSRALTASCSAWRL